MMTTCELQTNRYCSVSLSVIHISTGITHVWHLQVLELVLESMAYAADTFCSPQEASAHLNRVTNGTTLLFRLTLCDFAYLKLLVKKLFFVWIFLAGALNEGMLCKSC